MLQFDSLIKYTFISHLPHPGVKFIHIIIYIIIRLMILSNLYKWFQNRCENVFHTHFRNLTYVALTISNYNHSKFRYKAQEDQYNEFRMFSEQLENELELSLKAAEDKLSCLEPKSSSLEEECQRLKV